MASPPLAIARSPPPPKAHVVSVARTNPHRWSSLPLDLMQMVFERLGFTDFERAKAVCSSWLSGSRQATPNNKIPWVIMFPKDKSYCLLFNPEDKEKLYKTQHLGDDFGKSVCLGTHKSWLLMTPKHPNLENPLYIFDILTCERINLPIEFQGMAFPIFWIDEKRTIFLVDRETLFSYKKGDNSWRQIPAQLSGIQECFNMVFKDHKLYCLNYDELHIFNFSGEFPLLVSRVSVGGFVKHEECCRMRLGGVPWYVQEIRRMNNVVVTVGGHVLIVTSESPFMSETWNFRIFKMDSSKENIQWEEVFSMGDEAILLDLGITVLAKDLKGVTSNSIYFTGDEVGVCVDTETEIFVFNLYTKKIEQLPQFVYESVSFSTAHWFLPSFKKY